MCGFGFRFQGVRFSRQGRKPTSGKRNATVRQEI